MLRISIWPKPLIAGLLAGVIGLAANGASAVTLPRGVTLGPTAEGITEYRFANGFKLLLLPDNSKPTVTVNMTYRVGSSHENYGETGMAHLLEHLMFKGTPRYPAIPQEFNKRGMQSTAPPRWIVPTITNSSRPAMTICNGRLPWKQTACCIRISRKKIWTRK